MAGTTTNTRQAREVMHVTISTHQGLMRGQAVRADRVQAAEGAGASSSELRGARGSRPGPNEARLVTAAMDPAGLGQARREDRIGAGSEHDVVAAAGGVLGDGHLRAPEEQGELGMGQG